jgi:hypothetical protein
VRQGWVCACGASQWETAIEEERRLEFEIRNGAKRSSGAEARFRLWQIAGTLNLYLKEYFLYFITHTLLYSIVFFNLLYS